MKTMLYIVVFITIMGFMIFNFVRTPFTNLLILLPVFLSGIVFYVSGYGQFIPILINPNFQTDSGINGTYFDGPFQYHGGKQGYKVALFKWNVPPNSRRANRGISGLFSWLAAVQIIEIVDDKSKFTWITGKNLEATREKGCLRYHGRLDKGDLDNDETILRQKELWYRHLLGKLHTVMSKHKQIGEKESQEYNRAIIDMSEKLSTVMRDFSAANSQNMSSIEEQNKKEKEGI